MRRESPDKEFHHPIPPQKHIGSQIQKRMEQRRKYSDEELPTGVSQNGHHIGKLNVFEKMGRGCIKLISRLPLSVLYVIADTIYFFLYKVLSYRVKVVRANLETVFPNKTDKERKEIERAFYHHLCDYFLETVKALTISDEELQKRMVIRNPELVEQIMEQGRSVFCYAAHMGNWEWFTVWPLVFKPKFEIHAFYQSQSNNLANYITVETRTRRDIVAMDSKHAFRYTFKSIKDGAISLSLVIGDQCPHHSAQKKWIDFCGQDTPFLVGPEHISRKLKIALVYPSFVSYRRGYYEIEFHLIAEKPEELGEGECIKRFAAYLEDDLQRLPQLWLWSHRRWKLKHEDFPNE